jgi:hypothetical protein
MNVANINYSYRLFRLSNYLLQEMLHVLLLHRTSKRLATSFSRHFPVSKSISSSKNRASNHEKKIYRGHASVNTHLHPFGYQYYGIVKQRVSNAISKTSSFIA